MAHMVHSERRESALGHLHTCIYATVVVFLCGTPNCERRYVSDSLAFIWDSFPPCGLSFAWQFLPCLIVFCLARFGCCASEACFSQKSECILGEVKWGTAERRESWRSYSWKVYERRINFQKRKKKTPPCQCCLKCLLPAQSLMSS